MPSIMTATGQKRLFERASATRCIAAVHGEIGEAD
jgi:hypothetical protein